MSEGRQIQDRDLILQFVLAGNATFTLRSVKTGERRTFKVRKTEETPINKGKPLPWFVSVLNGPDNWSNYAYMGLISAAPELAFKTTRNSKIGVGTVSFQVFEWFWRHLNDESLNLEGLEFWHEGKCARCGRKLTVPESIASGFGPECLGKF